MTGGLSSSCTAFFTNPLETIKTRMQLQGELKQRGAHDIHYKNVFHAAWVIAKHDGILTLQAGLVPGVLFQFFANGIRFGFYMRHARNGFDRDENGRTIWYKTMALAGIGGAFGFWFASPFYLVKTHLQSKTQEKIAFGHQHEHSTMRDGFKAIWREQGFSGLYRGSSTAVLRGFFATGGQLAPFNLTKDYLIGYDYLKERKILISFLAAMIGGVFATLAVTPFDVVATRLYNQGTDSTGKGHLYTGYFNCFIRIFKTEGFLGFYKGLGASYFRLGPHTVINLMLWDAFKMLHAKYTNATYV